MRNAERSKALEALRALCEQMLEEIDAEPHTDGLRGLMHMAGEARKLAAKLGLVAPLTIACERGDWPPNEVGGISVCIRDPFSSEDEAKEYQTLIRLTAIRQPTGNAAATRVIKALTRYLVYLKMPHVQDGTNCSVVAAKEKKGRGPKPRYDASEDRKIFESWIASGSRSYEEFATAARTSSKPLSGYSVRRAIERHKKRESRKC